VLREKGVADPNKTSNNAINQFIPELLV